MLRRFVRHRGGVIGLSGLLLLLALALALPLVAPNAELATNLSDQFLTPSLLHPFGTDELGRDVFARTIAGGRISLITAAVAVAVALVVGVPLGLAAGFLGGWTETAVMRLMDVLLAVPAVLLAMSIIAILGRGTSSATIAVAIVSIPTFARLARSSTLALKEQDFVLAARAVGARDSYIAFRTILPNASSPIIVQMAITSATAVLLEAALSFLGLGTRPPEPSWGSLLSSAKGYVREAPWYAIFPGAIVTAAVLCLDGLANGLQATFGPRREGARGPSAIRSERSA
jgi:peptide/nickel transport system permease protein